MLANPSRARNESASAVSGRRPPLPPLRCVRGSEKRARLGAQTLESFNGQPAQRAIPNPSSEGLQLVQGLEQPVNFFIRVVMDETDAQEPALVLQPDALGEGQGVHVAAP